MGAPEKVAGFVELARLEAVLCAWVERKAQCDQLAREYAARGHYDIASALCDRGKAMARAQMGELS